MERSAWRSLLLVVLVATAGCSSVGDTLAPATDADGGTDARNGTVTTNATASTASNATTVTVVEVVDGDTVVVEYPNGTQDTARLLGVDTPEVHVENEPAEFEGVSDTEAGRACLRDWGHKASEFVRTQLLGERVNLTVDPNEPRRDVYGRLLVYVHRDDDLFNYRLVSQGYARVYDSQFAKRDRFYAAEERAQSNATGLWHCRSPDATATDGGTESDVTSEESGTNATDGTASSLAVANVHADAAGNDHENLDGEYVVFENTGDAPLDLSGWTVADEAGHEYVFPDGFVLDPGATVTLYTGHGTDSGTGLYWGADGAVWNNGGDTVIVTNEDGETVIRFTYSG